jgi:hypothetical protein
MAQGKSTFIGDALAFAGSALILVALSCASAAASADDASIDPFTYVGRDATSATGEPNRTWYTVTPDRRLCPSPLCGGYVVKRVNRQNTICADGTRAPSCYVAELDLSSSSGFSPEQQSDVRRAIGHALVRATIDSKPLPPFGDLGVLRVQEAWIGHERIAASGTFVRAKNSGIVCIAFPCPTVDLMRLNRAKASLRIAGVDLGDVTDDPADGYAQLNAPEGLLVAGTLVPVSGPAGAGRELAATEYYLPVLPAKDLCGSRGLPSCEQDEFCHLPATAQCGRADRPGVCEPRPQACTTIFDPVCGCDGVTYSNECVANAAGVSVDHQGAGGK